MILVDTGPLVALCDSRDSRHGTAIRQLKKLASLKLCTCEAVLVECCFHLPGNAQRERLQYLIEALRITSVLGLEAAHDWPAVFAWLTKYADHEPDWADASLAVLCGRDKQLKVWTFDSEFRSIWRRPDGSPIPLAARV